MDREALTARLTWDVIEPALKTVPRTVLLAGRDPSADCLLGGDRLITTSDGMTTYMLDDVTGERRDGTTADLADITRLCDALSEIDTLWPSPNPGDAPPDVAPLVTQAVMVRNTTKHVQDEVRVPEMVEPILEIYEAACGASLTERPCFSVTNCTIAPLQHDRDMTEAGLKMVHRGVPIFVLPMPQAGTTGPMTLLGTCILNMAELLSGVVLYQLAHPGCSVVSGVGSAVADMRSGGYIASSPEIGLINMICLEMSRFYGLPTQATGMSADAKAANFQAGSEGGMTALTAALAGADSLISAGGLDGVQVSSLAKYVLDNDQIGALRRYLREDTIDDTTALMDDILDVGIGGHFLGRKSTRAFSRSEVWRRRCSSAGRSRSSPGGRSQKRPPLARARSSRRMRSAAARGRGPAHRRGISGWARARAGRRLTTPGTPARRGTVARAAPTYSSEEDRAFATRQAARVPASIGRSTTSPP